jgi:hypothetical protein
VVAVFSCGGGFNIMAGPGFFVPVLGAAFFILRVKAAQKRAAVTDSGKVKNYFPGMMLD